MSITHNPGIEFSTPLDIEVKQYKGQETFTANNVRAELQNLPDGSRNMVILCKINLINIYVYEVMDINYRLTKVLSQQAIGYQKEIKKTLGKTSETDAYLKFEMTSYVKCQTDL